MVDQFAGDRAIPCPCGDSLRCGLPLRPFRLPAVIDLDGGGDLLVDRLPQVVAQRGERIDGVAYGRRRGGGRLAVPKQELPRGIAAAALPGVGERVELTLLQLPCSVCCGRDRLERRAIGFQRAQVQPVLAAVPVPHLRGMQREIRILVAEQVACPHIVADVVDGRTSLSEARVDV